VFTLVPHTTHAMQPLDTAVYGPLKTHWQDACHENASSVSSKVQVTSPNVLSKYLVQYVPASQVKKKASETRVTGL